MRFPEDVPVLDDGVVRLRAHTAADVDGAFAMCSDPEFQRWTTVPVPYRRANAEHFLLEKIPAGWRDGGFWGWAIEYDGRFAGTIDLRDGAANGGEIGFGLAPWARGHGLMTRAARLVTRHAFDGFGWDVVVWRAIVGNWGSRRVAWKAGFSRFGTAPASAVQRGERHDEWVASITPEDTGDPVGQWWRVPVLEGAKARLRPHRDSDAPRIVEACSDERTQTWLPFMPSPYDEAEALKFIRGRSEENATGFGVSWAVADPETDLLIANVGVFRLSAAGSAEVGYWAHPDSRGRGVVSEAVGLAVRYAFQSAEEGGLGRHRLYIRAAVDNPASQQVALRNGFRLAGTDREADLRRDGSRVDMQTFDRLVTDTH
jgi:RimJ/RimL family protein N-acetyltransferase